MERRHFIQDRGSLAVEEAPILHSKNCDLLFRCHFRRQTTPEMAAFQQLPSATLLHPLTTHQLTHRSCLRPRIRGRLHPLFPEGLIKRFIVAHCTLMGAPNMASFSTPAAGVWLVPSRHGYKCTFPNYRSSNFLSPFRLQPPLQTSISLTFLPCYLLSSRPLIHLNWQFPHMVGTNF